MASSTVDLRRRLFALMHAISVASMLGAGVVGGIALPRVGPALVMGAAIYLGNTEPGRPVAPYPWGVAATCLLVVLLGALGLRRGLRGGGLVLEAGALGFALVPILALWQLWAALPPCVGESC